MKKVLTILILICLCYTVYAAIGYAVIGFSSPVVFGETRGFFAGNFLWAFVYLIISILLIIVFIILHRKRGKKR